MAEENYFEPGAARYGNFISYYSFHSPKERLDLLPFQLFLFAGSQPKDTVSLLDVGCNTGELTEELYKELSRKRECELLAIDIDDILIKRAQERNSFSSITYKCLDITSKDDFSSSVATYFSNKSRKIFDITFLFSITMWIHLNSGDEGLLTVLKMLAEISDILVVEPQPWKCYRSAARRLKRAKKKPFPFYNKIKIRGENLENTINDFLKEKCCLHKIYESPRTSWGRKINIYQKNS